jgi:hypothetical protein
MARSQQAEINAVLLQKQGNRISFLELALFLQWHRETIYNAA